MNLNFDENAVKYIDLEGYKKIEVRLNEIDNEISDIANKLKDASDEESRKLFLRSQQKLKEEKNEIIYKLNCFQIINRQSNENVVEIGDVLRLNFIFSSTDMEEMIGKLVGNAAVSTDDRYEEISIHGPVGSNIYGKNIGETVFIKEKSFSVEIMEKLSLEQEQKSSLGNCLKKELKK